MSMWKLRSASAQVAAAHYASRGHRSEHYGGRGPRRPGPSLVQVRSDEKRYEGYRRDAALPAPPDPTPPRSAATERICFWIAVQLTAISIVVIIFFSMMYPALNWPDHMEEDNTEVYPTECPLTEIIPLHGTVSCSSTRPNITQVSCNITCQYGIKEEEKASLVLLQSENSFLVTCSELEAWEYDVNSVCKIEE